MFPGLVLHRKKVSIRSNTLIGVNKFISCLRDFPEPSISLCALGLAKSCLTLNHALLLFQRLAFFGTYWLLTLEDAGLVDESKG